MADNLEWVFSLTDKMSGPAKDIAKNVRAVSKEVDAYAKVIKAYNRTPLHMTEAFNKQRSLGNRIFSGIVNKAGSMFGPKGAQAVLGTANALVKADDALGMVGMSLGGVVGGGAMAATAAIVAVGGAAIYAGAKLSSMAIDYGTAGAKFAVQTGMFREDTLLGLETMLKSKKEASILYSKAVKFAAVTPFDTKDVVGMATSMIGSGFKPSELMRVMTAVGDMAASKGMNKELIGRLNLAMSQIRSKGALKGNEMMQLTEAGVGAKDVYSQIGKMMGGKSTADVMKLQERGKISSEIAIEAILKTVENTYGGAMDRLSGGMRGLMSTLQSRPFDLVDAAINDNAGMSSFNGSIKIITDSLQKMLDPSSASGSRIVLVLNKIGQAFKGIIPSGEDVANLVEKIVKAAENLMPDIGKLAEEIGGGLKNMFPKDSSAIEGFGRTIITMLRMVNAFVNGFVSSMADAFGQAFGGEQQSNAESMRLKFEAMGKALGKIVTFLGKASGFILEMNASVTELWDKLHFSSDGFNKGGERGDLIAEAALKDTGETQGTAVADGFIGSILKRGSDAFNAGVFLGSNTEQGLATKNESHSPSHLSARYGAWFTEGYIEGMAAPDLNGAIRQTFSIPSGGFGAGSFGGSPVTVGSISVSAPLNLSGADTETAQAAQNAVERLLPDALATALEQVAAQWGVS